MKIPLLFGAGVGVILTFAVLLFTSHSKSGQKLPRLKNRDPSVVKAPTTTILSSTPVRIERLDDGESVGAQPMPPEELRGDVSENERQQLLIAFHREPLDRAWAASSEISYQEDLIKSGQGKVELGTTRCRSSRCVTDVTWASGSVARESMSYLAAYPYRLDCVTSVFLTSEGSAEGEPAKGQVHFICER